MEDKLAGVRDAANEIYAQEKKGYKTTFADLARILIEIEDVLNPGSKAKGSFTLSNTIT